jgi:hypothetical protein
MTTQHHPTLKGRYSGGARISVFVLIAPFMFFLATALLAQRPVDFDKSWWASLTQNEKWDFIYGYTDCGPAIQSGLNMGQYEDFISQHVTSNTNSVPTLIRLAPHKVTARPQLSGGEVWKERHGFNDGDLWGDDIDEGRAWVEGYLACESRPVNQVSVDRYVRLIIRHYGNPKRHLDKLADVLEPLLPHKKPEPAP